MSGKICIIIGKTLSGKSTIVDILEKDHNMERVVSFTTRPIRENEKNGKDYHFINNALALTIITMGKGIAVRTYIPHSDFGPYPWYYGIEKSEITKKENPVVITDVQGLLDLQKEFGKDNITSFYIDIDEKEQEERMKTRKTTSEKEQRRRILADLKDFENAEELVDLTIKTSKKTKPSTIAKKISSTIKGIK